MAFWWYLPLKVCFFESCTTKIRIFINFDDNINNIEVNENEFLLIIHSLLTSSTIMEMFHFPAFG